jgi:hypothetical protein
MDNGNVVINTDGNVIWSTNTTQPGETTASAPVSATPGAPAPEPVSNTDIFINLRLTRDKGESPLFS